MSPPRPNRASDLRQDHISESQHRASLPKVKYFNARQSHDFSFIDRDSVKEFNAQLDDKLAFLERMNSSPAAEVRVTNWLQKVVSYADQYEPGKVLHAAREALTELDCPSHGIYGADPGFISFSTDEGPQEVCSYETKPEPAQSGRYVRAQRPESPSVEDILRLIGSDKVSPSPLHSPSPTQLLSARAKVTKARSTAKEIRDEELEYSTDDTRSEASDDGSRRGGLDHDELVLWAENQKLVAELAQLQMEYVGMMGAEFIHNADGSVDIILG